MAPLSKNVVEVTKNKETFTFQAWGGLGELPCTAPAQGNSEPQVYIFSKVLPLL